jgi:hypothetical protein
MQEHLRKLQGWLAQAAEQFETVDIWQRAYDAAADGVGMARPRRATHESGSNCRSWAQSQMKTAIKLDRRLHPELELPAALPYFARLGSGSPAR